MDLNIESIWKEYRTKILQFVLSRVDDPGIAEDITQDVFVKTFEKIGSLQRKDKLQSWLYQITRNAIFDHYRSKKSFVELPDLPQAGEDSSMKAIKGLSECLIPMINKLPALYRDAILLSEIEGKTHKEIATAHGISLSGSKTRVQRGRAQLKKMLSDCCRLEFDHRGRLTDYEETHDSCSDCQSPNHDIKSC
jgi:RNA polymerase sigma-70 factor, ECF subfamily